MLVRQVLKSHAIFSPDTCRSELCVLWKFPSSECNVCRPCKGLSFKGILCLSHPDGEPDHHLATLWFSPLTRTPPCSPHSSFPVKIMLMESSYSSSLHDLCHWQSLILPTRFPESRVRGHLSFLISISWHILSHIVSASQQ